MEKYKLKSGENIFVVRVEHNISLRVFAVALTDTFYNNNEEFPEKLTKKEAEKITAEDDEILKASNVQKIGTKTFYMENQIWIDGEFKEDAKLPEVKLKFASNEFFDLISKEKDLAQYFSLGEQVVVVWKGKVYRIIK